MTVFKELIIGDKGLTREGEIVTITSINKSSRFPLGYFSNEHNQTMYVTFMGRYEYYEWLETPKNSPHDLIRGLKLDHWNKIKDTKMKTDKTKLLQDIEVMKEKLASMEQELNKPDEFKHFPSKGDEYYYYTSIGAIHNTTAADNELRLNAYKTREEAQEAYNKAVALEKIKRRILELQGDWEPDWSDTDEEKYCIQYEEDKRNFSFIYWCTTQQDTSIPYMKNERIALTIIKEMEDELKLIFDIV